MSNHFQYKTELHLRQPIKPLGARDRQPIKSFGARARDSHCSCPKIKERKGSVKAPGESAMSVGSNTTTVSSIADAFTSSRVSGSEAEEGPSGMNESDVLSCHVPRVNIWDDEEPDHSSQQVNVLWTLCV